MVTDGASLTKNSKTFARKLIGGSIPLPAPFEIRHLFATWNPSVEDSGANLCQICVSAAICCEERLSVFPVQLGLAPAQHLLEALTSEPESLRGPGLRPALAQRVLDHPALERLDGLVAGTRRRNGAGAGRDAVGQMRGSERATVVCERHRALDLVLQFAHVSRPGVAAEELERLYPDRQYDPPRPPAGVVQQVVNEGGDVLGPLAKRWEANGKDVESIVEVAAEATGGHVGLA